MLHCHLWLLLESTLSVNHIWWCWTQQNGDSCTYIATYVFVRPHWSREYSRHSWTQYREWISQEPLSINPGPNYALELFKVERVKGSGSFSRASPISYGVSILPTVQWRSRHHLCSTPAVRHQTNGAYVARGKKLVYHDEISSLYCGHKAPFCVSMCNSFYQQINLTV